MRVGFRSARANDVVRTSGTAVFCGSANRSIEMNNAVVEPLALFSTLGEDKDRALPVLTTENLISEQSA